MAPRSSSSVTVSPDDRGSGYRGGGDGCIVWLEGEHDWATAAQFAEAMAQVIAEDDAEVVIDLSGVTAMDASTASVIIRARKLLRPTARSLVLRSPSECARRVLSLYMLGDLLNADDGLERADDAGDVSGPSEAPRRTVREPMRRGEMVAHSHPVSPVSDLEVEELLKRLAARCVDALEVDAGGLVVVASEGEMRVMASSDDAPQLRGLLEIQAEEGPAFDCYRSGQPVVNQDLGSASGRWPRFAQEGMGAGFRTVHAFPIRLDGSVLGALNLFQVEPKELSPAEVAAAQAFAEVAAVALVQHEAVRQAQILNEQLVLAMNSRMVIEQARGMVAERHGLDMHEASTLLRAQARIHGVRLIDVARDAIDGNLRPMGDPPPDL